MSAKRRDATLRKVASRKGGFATMSPAKAKKMLADGTAHGHPLSAKQKSTLHMIVAGKRPKRLGRR